MSRPRFTAPRRAASRCGRSQRVGAKFQRLHHVVFYGEFPRNIAGKTLKREMREAYRKVP
jgi:acyl-CoA synthetase (AMP-forming)/AMP-acid ligase II